MPFIKSAFYNKRPVWRTIHVQKIGVQRRGERGGQCSAMTYSDCCSTLRSRRVDDSDHLLRQLRQTVLAFSPRSHFLPSVPTLCAADTTMYSQLPASAPLTHDEAVQLPSQAGESLAQHPSTGVYPSITVWDCKIGIPLYER